MDRSVYFIKNPPVEDDPKYILVIYRPSPGVFGGGGRHTVVGVDDLETVTNAEGEPILHRGWRKGEKVVEFPSSHSYLLISRDLVEMLTPVEAAKRHKEEDEEIAKVLGDPSEHEMAVENDRSLRYL